MIKSLIKKTLNLLIFSLVLVAFFFVSTNINVSAEYVEPDQELRAVWVSPWGGDSNLVTYKSEQGFKSNMNSILDTLEKYNFNTIIYHVRTHNNALYKSELNPVASYWEGVNFDEFDPLEWMIDECHKRGIEFHAWMNPYRVKSSSSTSLENIASSYKDFPQNPASNVDNMLLGDGTTILNPGLQNVRDFICETVMEFVKKYDADAIHFDDYFYCDMGASGATSGSNSILIEPDQVTYEAYIDANPTCGYKKTSATNKADWRREQVDLFIEQLHNDLNEYNTANNKYVQLGIAPTGIYKNGSGLVKYDDNGNATSDGSATGGQTHYSSYLFCDTVNWINHEWIDYIMPQSYWGFGRQVAKYNEVMGWWDKIVKYKKVNLYSGMGIYMANNNNTNDTWQTDMNEMKNELEYIASSENIDGASFYNYNTFSRINNPSDSSKSTIQSRNALTSERWQNTVPAAKIKSFNAVNLSSVDNLYMNGNMISFKKLDKAKFYVVYRSASTLSFESNEIVDIFGSKDDIVTWTDKESGNYNYGVRALSYTNTLGLPATATHKDNIDYFKVGFVNEDGSLIETQMVLKGENAILPNSPTKEGYDFVGWEGEYHNVQADVIIRPIFEIKSNKVTINVVDGTINGKNSEKVEYSSLVTVVCDDPNFSYWVINGAVVSSDKEFTFSACSNMTVFAQKNKKVHDEILFNVNKLKKEKIDGNDAELEFYLVQINNLKDRKVVEYGAIYGERDPYEFDAKKIVGSNINDINEYEIDMYGYPIRFYCVLDINGVNVVVYSNLY